MPLDFANQLSTDVGAILSTPWNVRDGTVVPSTASVTFAGGGVNLKATMLYADLADSTELASTFDRRVAAKVVKSFLLCATRIIRSNAGHVRSFDGDRVMGVFLGERMCTRAAKTALTINWAMQRVLKPRIAAAYPGLAAGGFVLRHCTGVDVSDMLVVRTGIRDNDDLIWVGRAANIAAKLATIRHDYFYSVLSDDVFNRLAPDMKNGGSPPGPMWEDFTWTGGAPVETSVYASHFLWIP